MSSLCLNRVELPRLLSLSTAKVLMRDCPENCREAVASLMFAAARFSDLPELRELRDLFQERYGNSLELLLVCRDIIFKAPCSGEENPAAARYSGRIFHKVGLHGISKEDGICTGT
ncbi:hypothetical protein MTR67_031437 [Solanum verrucosum]|uniref:Uncharacterized protein n=1 Tax=Solanum verrucosum TaxID=315347 RepID=A0AAF0U2J5_SOLVR|nr:hypothetical protein MTR67_031437 [Solanum verrucosum]